MATGHSVVVTDPEPSPAHGSQPSTAEGSRPDQGPGPARAPRPATKPSQRSRSVKGTAQPSPTAHGPQPTIGPSQPSLAGGHISLCIRYPAAHPSQCSRPTVQSPKPGPVQPRPAAHHSSPRLPAHSPTQTWLARARPQPTPCSCPSYLSRTLSPRPCQEPPSTCLGVILEPYNSL